jgi:hypothetical protein
MRTFVLNDTEYTVQTDGDTPPDWKINVLRDGTRVNDVPYVISQSECDLIQAATGRNPLDELARIAEADVVLGRNQLCQSPAAQIPNKLANLKNFVNTQEAIKRSAINLICAFLPIYENQEDDGKFADDRRLFAEHCANLIAAGEVMDFGSLETKFKEFRHVA